MDYLLNEITNRQGGVVMRAQARSAGLAADEIDAKLRRKEWISVRRGAYVEREIHDAWTPEQRHHALIHAVTRSLRTPAVVSHVSAVVLRGLPTWGLDLSEVHVSRAGLHSPRHDAGVHHHAGELLADEMETVHDIRVTSLARTVIDTARITPFEASVTVADAAFRVDPDSQKVALQRLNTMRDWQGSRNAGAVIAFADGRSENPGESRCRVLFHNIGLPEPDLQREFYSLGGRLIGRADFYFEEEQTIGEFDGKGKYLRPYRPNEDPGEVVWREKQREDRLRELGLEVVRVITPDLGRPAAVKHRFHQAFTRARQLRRHAA